MDKPKPTTALIDGDILRYQLGAVLNKGSTITIGGTTINVPQSQFQSDKLTEETIIAILDATGAENAILYLSEGHNFRFQRATIQPYKGNRTGFVKPYHYGTIGRFIKENYNTKICIDYEADDHLAQAQDLDGSTVICSRDKDLRIRGGWHYSWRAGERNPEKPLYWITETEGIRWFYKQLLIGDSIDNILGCAKKVPDKKGNLRRKGIGPKHADALLSPLQVEQEMFNAVARSYVQIYGNEWEEAILENGTLLWMSDQFIHWEDLDSTKELLENFKKEVLSD